MSNLQHVENLLRQAKHVQEEYLALLPVSVKQEAWVLGHHDPNPWATLTLRHPTAPGIEGVRIITGVIAQLEGLLIEEKAAERPPDLTLGRWAREGSRGYGR